MELIEALRNKEDKILSIWVKRTLETYTDSVFFKQSGDRFANPVGVNVKEGLTRLFQLLVKKSELSEFSDAVAQVVRIRAVQDFTPSQAVVPFLELKWVVRQVLADDKRTIDLLGSLDEFYCDVDRVALLAFDIYTDCRERLYKNRVNELKSGRYILTDASCASAMIKENQQDINRISKI